jgi:hypothetical protein
VVTGPPGVHPRGNPHDRPTVHPAAHRRFRGPRPPARHRRSGRTHPGLGRQPAAEPAADGRRPGRRQLAGRLGHPRGLHRLHHRPGRRQPRCHGQRGVRPGQLRSRPGPGRFGADVPRGPRERLRDRLLRRRAGPARPADPRRPRHGRLADLVRRDEPGDPPARHPAVRRDRRRAVRRPGPDVRRHLPPGPLVGRSGRRRGVQRLRCDFRYHLADRPAVPGRGLDELHHVLQPVQRQAGQLRRP